jgi:hypothetical protein
VDFADLGSCRFKRFYSQSLLNDHLSRQISKPTCNAWYALIISLFLIIYGISVIVAKALAEATLQDIGALNILKFRSPRTCILAISNRLKLTNQPQSPTLDILLPSLAPLFLIRPFATTTVNLGFLGLWRRHTSGEWFYFVGASSISVDLS